MKQTILSGILIVIVTICASSCTNIGNDYFTDKWCNLWIDKNEWKLKELQFYVDNEIILKIRENSEVTLIEGCGVLLKSKKLGNDIIIPKGCRGAYVGREGNKLNIGFNPDKPKCYIVFCRDTVNQSSGEMMYRNESGEIKYGDETYYIEKKYVAYLRVLVTNKEFSGVTKETEPGWGIISK